jgi:hypothetical protein
MMITTTFETRRFRVQFVGRNVSVETRDGAAWIFRDQESLPLALGMLQVGYRPTIFRSAVTDFERTRNGDSALREALTTVGNAADQIREPHPLVPATKSDAILLKSTLPNRVWAKP